MGRTKLRYGQIGGTMGAFIGHVHRRAIAIEESANLVAGCFSSDAERNGETADFYELDKDRVYADYKEMIAKESQREDKMDFVVICTPNRYHYEAAKACLEGGFHVVCEKPLCFKVEEAEELQKLAKEKGLLFAVTYTYPGYAMVKFAKELIAAGKIGEVINVNAEYLQDWLIDEASNTQSAQSKLSVWRMDPEKSGATNCVGDIGTHIEAIVRYMTGLKTTKVAAKLDRFGAELDLNANMLVELENGAHGIFTCSQICCGHYNGLVVRIFGTEGAIEWEQENPEQLKVTLRGEPTQIYNRGTNSVTGLAERRGHIPSGHPEGLMIAFANTYRAYCDSLLKLVNGQQPSGDDLDYPDIDYGVDGVRFIAAVIKSDAQNAAWVEI